jgi:hypothetical protein
LPKRIPSPRDFEAVQRELETIISTLRVVNDPTARRTLLQELANLINEADHIIGA